MDSVKNLEDIYSEDFPQLRVILQKLQFESDGKVIPECDKKEKNDVWTIEVDTRRLKTQNCTSEDPQKLEEYSEDFPELRVLIHRLQFDSHGKIVLPEYDRVEKNDIRLAQADTRDQKIYSIVSSEDIKVETPNPTHNENEYILGLPPTLQSPTKESNQESRSQCDLCGKELSSVASLNSHIMRLHSKEKHFKCDICDKKFCTNCELLRHKLIHSAKFPFKCPMCDKHFRLKANMGAHMKLHTGEYPVHCDICHKGFTIKAKMLIHYRSVHQQYKPFKCTEPECKNRGFANKYKLNDHVNYVHKKEFKHKCEECGLKFRDNCKLKNHLNRHFGVKPFPCTICSKSFTKKDDLRVHEKSKIHTKKFKYRCGICGQGHPGPKHLLNHLKLHEETKIAG